MLIESFANCVLFNFKTFIIALSLYVSSLLTSSRQDSWAKTGAGISAEWGTGRIADDRLGYSIFHLFLLL